MTALVKGHFGAQPFRRVLQLKQMETTKTKIEHRRKKHCHFKTLTKHAFKPLLWGSPVTFTQTSQNSHSRRENMEAYFGDKTFLSNSEHVHILTLEKCRRNRALTLLAPATVRHQHWLSFLPITRRNLIPGQVLGEDVSQGNLTCWGDLGRTKQCFRDALKHQRSHPSAMRLLHRTAHVLMSCSEIQKPSPSVAVTLLTFHLHSGTALLLKATH